MDTQQEAWNVTYARLHLLNPGRRQDLRDWLSSGGGGGGGGSVGGSAGGGGGAAGALGTPAAGAAALGECAWRGGKGWRDGREGGVGSANIW